MARKEVINKFDKGLMMDANPLSTSPEVLTSALNVTLITFNGSEFILQSDMGNGRVETAYLPEGYVPVGMVEFGGIIYVCSYNPFDNRGQIGSFPSPERNISSTELGQSVITLKESDFDFDSTNGAKVLYVQKNLYENKLSPGDKYLVYAGLGQISGNDGLLWDYGHGEENTKGETVLDTKALELYFATITDEGKIVRLGNLRLHDVDGKQYIIPEMSVDGSTGIPILDSYREVVQSPYNIFNSKVSGKLLLIAELLTPDSFSVSISCSFDGERTIKDDTGNNIEMKNIHIIAEMSYESENEIFLYGVNGWYKDNGGAQNNIYAMWDTSTVPEHNAPQSASNRYMEAEMAYIKDYDTTNHPKRDISYRLVPCMPYGPIDYLAQSGIIQLDKIGTGYTELYEWRYYIDNTSIMINWAMQCYPEEGYAIAGVRFVMSYVDRNEEVKTLVYNVSPKKSYNGSFTETIPFDTEYYKFQLDPDDPKRASVLERDRLYYVTIEVMYKKASGAGFSNPEQDTAKYKHFYRWLYTCDIFNDIYRHGVVYDFITLNPTLLLGSTADSADISIKALDEEKVYTYKGKCLSDTEITNEDSLSCEQYHNKYYVSSEDVIYAKVMEDYNLFVLQPVSVNLEVTCKNKEDVKTNVPICDIQSVSGTVPLFSEQMVDIHARDHGESGEITYDPFRPPMSSKDEGAASPFEPDFTEEKYQNDMRLQDYKDVEYKTKDAGTFTFGYGEAQTVCNIILESVEHVKAVGSIERRSIAAKTVVRPICYYENDFLRYNIVWDEDHETPTGEEGESEGYFIGNWMGTYCRNDPEGKNDDQFVQFSSVNEDGTYSSQRWDSNNDMDCNVSWHTKQEYIDGSNATWGTTGSTLIVSAYSAYRRGDDNNMWARWRGYNCNLHVNPTWGWYGWSHEDVNFFAYMQPGKNTNIAVHAGYTLFVAMRTRRNGTWAPINMACVPMHDNVTDPYSMQLEPCNAAIYPNLADMKNIYNAVAAMLIQLYWCSNTAETVTLYAPTNCVYDYRVMTDFSVTIHIKVSYDEADPTKAPKIYIQTDKGNNTLIDESLRIKLRDQDWAYCYKRPDSDAYTTADEIALIDNNITFKYNTDEYTRTLTLQSERSADHLAQFIIDGTQDTYNALIRCNDGGFSFTNNSFRTGEVLFVKYNEDTLSYEASSINYNFDFYESVKFKRKRDSNGQNIILVSQYWLNTSTIVGSRPSADRFKGKLYVDENGWLYLDDTSTGEALSKMESNVINDYTRARKRDRNPNQYNLAGFSSFTPFNAFAMFKKS